jgi:integrase
MPRRKGNGTGSLAQDGKSRRWIAWYLDADGVRRKRSTGTTNRRDAEHLLATWTQEVQRVRAGLIDPDELRRRDERLRPLSAHVAEYFGAFGMKPRTKGSIQVKRCILKQVQELARILLGREPRLSDLTPDLVRRMMRNRIDAGLSACTANQLRRQAVALANWLTAEGRANLSDFGARIPTFNEEQDRRRERRALTEDELVRLLEVADERGRALWYSLAYWAGMRRGELGRLEWRDIDLPRGFLRIRNSKAGRIDEIALRPNLLALIEAEREAQGSRAQGSSRVFSHLVGKRTRRRDFERAGIPEIDADGRYADLHALRATLCTNLARNGVPIQVAQRVLRHADPRTTQRHYTALRLIDLATAINALPEPARKAPTGFRRVSGER